MCFVYFVVPSGFPSVLYSSERRFFMEWLLLIGGIWLASVFYKAGKRTGSRKGYRVGRAHQRRIRYRR